MKHCICFILSAVFLLNLNGQEKEKNCMSAAGISRDKHVSLQSFQTIRHKNQEKKMPRPREEIMKDINYDESRIPACTLPSPLDRKDGGRIATAYEWVNRRRPEVLALYQKEVYGQIPPRPDRMWFETLSVREDALDGAAIRKEIRLHFAMDNGKSHSFVMLLYIPKNAKAPAPVFLGLNFKGNHAATDEKDVMMTGKDLSGGIVHPDGHASQVHRWQFRETIRRGYASATVCYHDIFPDRNDEASWHHSIYGLFYPDKTPEEIHARYSAIGAWAWGLSRMLDCLEREPMIDSAKAMVHGHSRLGKTALWTGATDPRFRLVMSNDSGCGGAALFKRCIGENGRSHTLLVPLLVRHSVCELYQERGGNAVRPALADLADRPAPRLHRECDGRFVGGPQRRVPFRSPCGGSLPSLRGGRTRHRCHAAARPARHRRDQLSLENRKA